MISPPAPLVGQEGIDTGERQTQGLERRMNGTRWSHGALMVLLVLLLAAGCRQGSADATTTPVTQPGATRPAATAPVPTTPTVPVRQTPTPTPTLEPGAILVQPPDAYLVAQSGEQKAAFGAFYWVHESGYAADVTSSGFEIQPEPLVVEAGETIRVELRGEAPPEAVTLEVFPEAGNKDRIGPQPEAMVAFIPRTAPLISADLAGSPGQYTWEAELAPGTYFVRLRVTWPEPARNPVPGRQPTAQYSFFITVP
jgi:hypothetical protein